MTELVETGVEAPEQAAAQPEVTDKAPAKDIAEVKVVSEQEQAERDAAALDDKLRKVFREAKRDRADDGKFAGKAPKTDEAVPSAKDGAKPSADKSAPDAKADPKDQTPDKSAEPDPAKAEKPAIAPPRSWSADKKAVWDAMPPEAREVVAQRETEAHKAISQLGEHVKRMEPIGRVLEQHRDTFQSKGLSYDQGISQLLTAQRALDQNPAAGIKQIADAYGVDLFDLVAGQDAQPNAQVSQLQNQVSALTQQLQEMQSHAQHRAAAEAHQRLGTIEQAIDKIAADKPDFAELAPEIEMLLPALRRSNPNASHEQIILDAYDKARWSNPASRQRLISAEAKAQEQSRIEAAKKAAEDARAAGAINVGGSAGTASTPDLDDALRAIVRRNRAA